MKIQTPGEKHLYLDARGHEKWQYAGHEKRIH